MRALGASFADVVMINSFHVWTSPLLTRDEHFTAFSAVKDEFMSPPHSAWTAVGTTGLLSDTGHPQVDAEFVRFGSRQDLLDGEETIEAPAPDPALLVDQFAP